MCLFGCSFIYCIYVLIFPLESGYRLGIFRPLLLIVQVVPYNKSQGTMIANSKIVNPSSYQENLRAKCIN